MKERNGETVTESDNEGEEARVGGGYGGITKKVDKGVKSRKRDRK